MITSTRNLEQRFGIGVAQTRLNTTITTTTTTRTTPPPGLATATAAATTTKATEAAASVEKGPMVIVARVLSQAARLHSTMIPTQEPRSSYPIQKPPASKKLQSELRLWPPAEFADEVKVPATTGFPRSFD